MQAQNTPEILYPSSLSDLEGEWKKIATYTIAEAELIYPKLRDRGPFAIMPARLIRGRRVADIYERVSGAGREQTP